MGDPPPRRVLMLAFEDCQILDVVGPLQMFAGANRHRTEPAAPYEIVLVAERAGALRTNSGLGLVADRGFDEISAEDLAGIHTFIVAGGWGTREALRNAALIEFVARAAEAAERVVSICTGALLLAAAGVLDGRQATTHWGAAALLSKTYPDVRVEADAIYLRDGKVWTSAGVTTGMDLAIALVEEDLGRAAALAVAREHVLYMMRPGGQSQFSAELSAQGAQGRTARAVRYIVDNLSRDLSVPALAAAAGLSQRTLLRAFREELNTTPADFVLRARVDAARRRLAAPRAPVERVAAACGFSSAETMRRAFQKSIGIAPAEYRDRFATAQRASP